MKLRLITSSLLAIVSATLIGCGGGGGGDGVTTSSSSSSSSPTPPVVTSGSTNLGALPTPAVMAGLSMAGSVQGVTINSPPVITFQLLNSDNNTALTGFDKMTVQRNKVDTGVAGVTGGTTDLLPFYPNFAFSIAKLVPGKNGSPSKWVSYMVSTPQTFDADGKGLTFSIGAPGSENNGTLKYLQNGQYEYKFRRDIKEVANQVAAATFSSTKLKDDLGDLTYDPNAVHRLVIQISSVARGSRSGVLPTTDATFDPSSKPKIYCNTIDGVCPDGYDQTPYEIMRTPVDLVYDWIPATGRVVKATETDIEQREIVNVAACASCHNKFTFHGGNALKGWGGGRQETRQCMVCHTDQRKFGSAGASASQYTDGFAFDTSKNKGNTPTINGIDAPNPNDVNDTSGRHSNLDFPVFIHKIHMGEELTRANYLVGGVPLNETKYPQLITNCAKCHSGDATKPDGSPNTVKKLDGTEVQMATTQGNNWYNKPSRLACGACHDGINFNTGLGTKLDGTSGGHGAGGVGGPQADDSKCATCHTPAAIQKVHVAVTPQNRNSSMFADCKSFNTLTGTCNSNANVAWIASNLNNLPAGAIKVSYDIKSVKRVVNPTDNTKFSPQMVFCIKLNDTCATFNSPPVGKTPAEMSNLEMLPNFMGAPSAYFVWGVTQDGITAPADFNASASGYLRSIWNGKASGTGAGTLIADPSNPGYYIVTLTGVTVPNGATMLTGGLGFSYAPGSTLPLTQTNLLDYPVTAATANGTTNSSGKLTGNGSLDLTATAAVYQPNKTGGLIVVAPDASVVASDGAGDGATTGAYTKRRPIVEDARCNNCHQELGAFNKSSFHAGQRNDGATCSWCHNPNRTSSGWSADSTNFIHGIHSSLKRTNGVDSAGAAIPVKFTWHASSTTDGYWTIGYPGVLKNCEACHLPGSYDFSNPASKAAVGLSGGGDKRLFRYSATGIFKTSANLVAAGTLVSQTQPEIQNAADLAVFSYSPYVTADGLTDYGAGFGFNAATGAITPASNANLLETPTATVCFACHTDDKTVKTSMGATAKAHMVANGAQLYISRGVATPLGAVNPAQSETCLTCHGPTSAANIKAVHSK